MIPSYFKGKPMNHNYILVETIGDINNPILCQPKENWIAKDITNITCTIFNTETNKLSDKSAYLHKSGRLYLKSRDGRLWLDEFKIKDELNE